MLAGLKDPQHLDYAQSFFKHVIWWEEFQQLTGAGGEYDCGGSWKVVEDRGVNEICGGRVCPGLST